MAEMDEETERTLIHGYYASLTYMDAQLARVMSALDQLKLMTKLLCFGVTVSPGA